MKDSNNIHHQSPTKIDLDNYAYHDKFIEVISIILFKPILSALEQRKQTKLSFVEELNRNGLNYKYYGFIQAARGKNNYCTNYNYISRIYEYLQLPLPTMDYLSSFM